MFRNTKTQIQLNLFENQSVLFMNIFWLFSNNYITFCKYDKNYYQLLSMKVVLPSLQIEVSSDSQTFGIFNILFWNFIWNIYIKKHVPNFFLVENRKVKIIIGLIKKNHLLPTLFSSSIQSIFFMNYLFLIIHFYFIKE